MSLRVRKAAASVVDQAFSVGGMFVVSIMLARTVSKQEYGLFVLSYSVYAFLTGVHNAFILEPYTIFGSGRYRTEFPSYHRFLYAANVAFGVVVSALLLITLLVLRVAVPDLAPSAMFALAATLPFLLTPLFVRRTLYLESNPAGAARLSLLFFALVCGILATNALHVWLTGFCAFFVVAGCWLVAITAGVRRSQYWHVPTLAVSRRRFPFLAAHSDYKGEHWNYSRWVLYTAFVFQLTTQGYYWLLAGFLSVRDVADLRAMYMIVTPVDNIFIAFSYLVIPLMSGYVAAAHFGRFWYVWKSYAFFIFFTTGTFAIGLRVFGPFIVHHLYAGRFDGVIPLLGVLALQPIIMGIGNVMADGLRVFERPKWAFYAFAASGAATIVIGIPLVRRLGLVGAAYGMLVSAGAYSLTLVCGFVPLVVRKRDSIVLQELELETPVQG